MDAGAVVQQYQNFINDPNTSVFDVVDVFELGTNITFAAISGLGDNPGDATFISGGHSYSTNVLGNDAISDSNSNSCDTSDRPDSSIDEGGGWSGGTFMGYGSCIGCASGSGSGSATITDLPSVKDEDE